jgi:four helix bundle protein
MAIRSDRDLTVWKRGSTIEVEVDLYLAEQVGYVQSPTLIKARSHCDAISRMISALRRKL